MTEYDPAETTPGETATMEVSESTDTFVAGVAVPPDVGVKRTVAPFTKPDPVIVTAVPPAVEPPGGDVPGVAIAVTCGGTDV